MIAYIPLLLVLVAFLLVRLLLKNPPERSAAVIIGGIPLALAGAGLLLTLVGRGVIGVPLTIIGLSWWRRRGPVRPTVGGGVGGGGRTSTVCTAVLEMELDHETGEMDGRILTGQHAGARLSMLTEQDVLGVYAACFPSETDSAALLESYLDRRFPGWRVRADTHRESPDDSTGNDSMTRDEAYQVLGLEPGASREEIHQAWRRLMKGVHPDSGGSAFLAARINAAKDVLLGR